MKKLLTNLNEKNNITVLQNPIEGYDEDGGLHPSPAQTVEIINFIDAELNDKFGIPYKLPSTTNESLVVERKYTGVHALYRYGCAACKSRERNKWFSVCNTCKDRPENDLQEMLQIFNKTVADLDMLENPLLTTHNTSFPSSINARERSPLKNNGETNDIKPGSQRLRSASKN